MLVEGGGKLLTSVLAAKLADRIAVFVAPIIIGKGIEAIGDLGTDAIDDGIKITELDWRPSEKDMLLVGKIKYPN